MRVEAKATVAPVPCCFCGQLIIPTDGSICPACLVKSTDFTLDIKDNLNRTQIGFIEDEIERYKRSYKYNVSDLIKNSTREDFYKIFDKKKK